MRSEVGRVSVNCDFPSRTKDIYILTSALRHRQIRHNRESHHLINTPVFDYSNDSCSAVQDERRLVKLRRMVKKASSEHAIPSWVESRDAERFCPMTAVSIKPLQSLGALTYRTPLPQICPSDIEIGLAISIEAVSPSISGPGCVAEPMKLQSS